MHPSLKPERPADGPAIDSLLDRAFGPDRTLKTSYRYRIGPPMDDLCRTAWRGPDLIGSIRYWPVTLDPSGQSALLLGPLAVHPGCQGQGVGQALVDDTLKRAHALGHGLVFLVGDPIYYRRFGFIPAPAELVMPDEAADRLMIRPLNGAALPGSGILRPVPLAG